MMRRAMLHIALAVPLFLHAQVRWDAVPMFRPAAFDAAAVAVEDEQREASGELRLYARNLPIFVSSEQGTWHTEGNERVCRMAIGSSGAMAMELLLENVEVPAGARLHVLDLNGHALHGYVGMDLPADVHTYSTPLVGGDHWILEYREPEEAHVPGRFTIAGVGHAYRDVEVGIAREGTCHVNASCHPESDGWDGPIAATVRISVVTPQGNGWCTGTLMNNVRQDCAPYILTAWHCGRTSTAQQFNQYKFYFNFQYATCAGGSYSTAQYVTGAQLKAYSDDYAPEFQGVGGSDFMLLRTNVAIPGSFDPYWAGWDATNIPMVTADGVCIHHPTGAPKRISSFTQTLTTGHPMTSSGLMTHYKAKWAPTTNGFGVTEEGSSGSGLFKPDAAHGPLLIGTLTGSSSGMNCTNNTGTAYFGKMSYHWTNNPNSTNIKLKPWLDPDNTGATVLGGSADPCGLPIGIPEAEEALFPAIAPNPADDRIAIRLSPGTGLPVRSRLVDAWGRTAAEWTLLPGDRSLDVRHLSAGTYTLMLLQEGRPPTAKRILIIH